MLQCSTPHYVKMICEAEMNLKIANEKKMIRTSVMSRKEANVTLIIEDVLI